MHTVMSGRAGSDVIVSARFCGIPAREVKA